MALEMKLFYLVTLFFINPGMLNGGATDGGNSTSSSMRNVKDNPHLSNAVNEFGHKLMITMMQKNKDDNVVISPTSVAGLLAMTLLGSIGNTYQELATTLGFSQDILTNRNNHEQFGELLQELNNDVKTSKTLYADAIFVDAHIQLRQVYREYLNRVYRGEAFSVDFRQKEEAKQKINEWVDTHTEGKIENFLKDSLPESTITVLLSALYFSGQWKQPFFPEYTIKMSFTTPNSSVMADLMLNFGEFEYISSENEGLHMVALPYNDSVTTLYAIQPRRPKQVHLLELMQRLNYTVIDNLINQMKRSEAVIRFPKMELHNNIKLEEALKDMGINTMFNPAYANFALMVDKNNNSNTSKDEIINKLISVQNEAGLTDILNTLPNPGVYVDSIIHDVKLSINEYGTEAVAATSGILARTAELFYADSPFYMFIRNEKTKLITFAAVIFDPTK